MSELWDAVMARGSRADVSEAVAREGGLSYDMRIVSSWMALGTTFDELWHVRYLLLRATNFTEIRVLLKLYVTSWTSLADLVALLINATFDLGYPDRQVELGAILQNKHIVSTKLPSLVAQHGKDVQYQAYSQQRNDIIHRGTWRDPEFDDLHGEWLMKTSLAIYAITPNDEGAREGATNKVAADMRLTERMHAFLSKRGNELDAHLKSTLVMLDEIGTVLAEGVRARPGT